MTRRPETPAELLARQYDTTPSVQNEDNLLVLVTPASSDVEPVFAFRLSKRAALDLGARLRAGEAVPVEPLDLIGLEYHACSSGTDTPPMVRRQILSACAEIRAIRAFAQDCLDEAYGLCWTGEGTLSDDLKMRAEQLRITAGRNR